MLLAKVKHQIVNINLQGFSLGQKLNVNNINKSLIFHNIHVNSFASILLANTYLSPSLLLFSNCEYATTELFDTFYNDYIDFKHYINDVLNILNERNTTSTKKTSVSEQILLLEEQVRILKLENKKLQEERKAQLNIIERFTENQNSDFRKETGNDWTTVPPNKNSKGLSSRQDTIPELQNLYSPL